MSDLIEITFLVVYFTIVALMILHEMGEKES